MNTWLILGLKLFKKIEISFQSKYAEEDARKQFEMMIKDIEDETAPHVVDFDSLYLFECFRDGQRTMRASWDLPYGRDSSDDDEF